jgi:polyferredoxin
VRLIVATVQNPLPVLQDDPARAPQQSKPRKRLVHRAPRDYSQRLRYAFQGLFLALNVALGVQFYLFVRHFESGGQTPAVSRPPGVEGWLPIAGLMNLKFLLVTGTVPPVHPAAMFLLISFLIISLIFRKAFCSWLCPVGTVSEVLWRLGHRLLKGNWALPRWADLPLRSVKYLLLGLFLYAVGSMSATALSSFLTSPYGLIADVKMLYFFRFLSGTAAITLLALAVLSLFIKNFWCRYLCPYGALMGLASLLSPSRIQRDPDRCIDCAKCARVCPAVLPVDKLASVRSAECTGCLECVAICPAAGALELSLPKKRRIPAWALAAGMAVVFLGTVGLAKLSGHWETPLPNEVYQRLIVGINEFTHP